MKILVLAGGSDQIALISELKSRGHETILIDYFENPPAKAYADKHIVASTLDIDRVEEIAIEEKVDLVCTACTDQALLTVAKVSEKLRLPCYISYQTGLNVTNKSYMKRVLVENNIPTAKFIILDSVDMIAIKEFQYPLVVKPVDCNSSKGVKRIDSQEELPKYLEEAINFSRTKTAIVEEFKIGEEISADFYIENGVAKYLSATNSFKIPNRKSFTILGSAYPVVNNDQRDQLVDIATNIAKVFKLDNSPLLIQLIANGNDINVIEFSARMGGGSKYKLIEVLSGVNIMSTYVDRILGGYPTVEPCQRVKYCKMVYTYCNPGVIDHIEGLEEMKATNVIDEYFIYKTKGMEIIHSETSGDRPAGYLVTAETEEELESKIKKVDAYIKVIDTNGVDILIHNLV
ncbi:MAG: ATP-grasp domain-containing protein [Bacteroidaceae bacterium]|nr:ATP-grasp domain-containing protein [Bacteroidaceae bacterium]